jgi:hypothetical protein
VRYQVLAFSAGIALVGDNMISGMEEGRSHLISFSASVNNKIDVAVRCNK